MPAPTRCRSGRPRGYRIPTRTTSRRTIINSASGGRTDICPLTITRCRRSATRWATGGRPSCRRRSTGRRSRWVLRIGRAACRRRWRFRNRGPQRHRRWAAGVWQDNFDGTYTQLDDDYYVPATGYSYSRLLSDGPDRAGGGARFFPHGTWSRQGRDGNGRPIFKAERTNVTIEDVIAVEGPRLPDVDHAQKRFNTGMVVIVEHENGEKPR